MENFTFNKLNMFLQNFTSSEVISLHFSTKDSSWTLPMLSNDTGFTAGYSQEIQHDAFKEKCPSMWSEIWGRRY